MKNLLSKLIPTVFLLSLPFLPSTAKAQEIQGSNSEFYNFYEFSYKNEIYRCIDVFSKQDCSYTGFILEKHGNRVDTVFNENESRKKMKEIEKIINYEEKIQKAEQLVDKASKYCFLTSKIRESFLIRNLFESEYKNWNIFKKHKEFEEAIEDGIKYLAYRGLEDIENPIPKPDFLRGLQSFTEQLQDLGKGLENFDKAWNDLTGEEPMSQPERDMMMRESRIMADKYLNSRGELSQQGKNYYEERIQQKIIRALEKTNKKEDYYSKRKVFVEEMSGFPRIATHPLAIFLAERYGYYKSMDNFLEYYKEIRIDEEEIYKKSSKIDFKYENYEYLLKNWEYAYREYDAIINLINSARWNNDWKPKSGLTKDFVKAINDKDGRRFLGSIAEDVHDEYKKTVEAKIFHKMINYGEAKKVVKQIKKQTKEYGARLINYYIDWEENLKKN